MSLILDALRKSDRQRHRNAAERLREGPGQARASRVSNGLVATGLVGLVAAAAVAGWLAFEQRPATDQIDTANLAANERAAVRALSTELSPANPVTRATTPAATIAAPQPATSRPATPSPITEAELRAPPLSALPEAIRAELPELHVDVHAWAEEPTARFVLINLRRYGEGDRLDEGPVVRGILRSGVVLEYRGQLFSLPRQ